MVDIPDNAVAVADIPVEKPRLPAWRQAALSLYWFSTQAQWTAILITLLPLQAARIGGEAQKGTTLGAILWVGAFASMIAAPFFGAWSDRVRTRWGRRKPFIVAGTLGNVLGLVLLAALPATPANLVPYILAFCWLNLISNLASAPYSALIPDVVPADQRGSASGWMGLMMMLGNFVGGICGLALGIIGGTAGAYLVLAVLMLLGMLGTVLFVDEPEPPPVERFDLRTFARGLITPFTSSDFRWVFLTRFLVMLGIFTVQEFLQYYMHDMVAGGRNDFGYRLFGRVVATNPESATSFFTLLLLVGAIVSTFFAGTLSDRYGRKCMVYISGALQGAVALIFLFTGQFLVVVLLGLVFGLGYGAYQSVDWALVTDVLPSAEDHAKDMGLWHIAVTLPQVTAAPIAGILLDHGQRFGNTHGAANLGYMLIFSLAFAYFLLGTVLVRKIKGAREDTRTNMLKTCIRHFIAFALRLRYHIDIRGLDEIRQRGTRGILFLPCHPAFIDPVMVVSTLLKDFSPHTIADANAVGAPGIRQLVERFGVRTMPSVVRFGDQARVEVERVLHECAAGLRNGENLLLYPAGRLMTSQREEIGANSAVEVLLRDAPEARVVLLRTRGLWGSSFGTAPHGGREPDLPKMLLRGIGTVLGNGIVFTPRREVTLEFIEPSDLPRHADRTELNRYLEAFYNVEPLPRNTHVPYFVWQGSQPVVLPEPQRAVMPGDLSLVPPATREIVTAHLQQATGVMQMRDDARLGHDLGMDSLARAELIAWLEGEFGLAQSNTDSLRTVGDVLLAASGEATAAGDEFVEVSPAERFVKGGHGRRTRVPEAATVAEAFLRQAQAQPDHPIIADQTSGVKTYRDLVTGIFALLPAVRSLPGDAVGIMLPASVAANLVYLTVLFAGKTPVMVNWTAGARNLRHTLDLTGTQRVITAQKLLARLQGQGIDLSALAEAFVPLESIAAGISRGEKLRAVLAARTNWSALWRAPIAPIAAILSTSGSESLPKGVPLTHANLLANLRDVLEQVPITGTDRLLGMLPPFHSFGLTANMLLALCGGVRTAYHANPTEGALLARLVANYRATLLFGTPTFLAGILRAASLEQLATLRLAVTGAEECPPRVYTMLAERCPHARILEGYGITEGSPVVSLNDYDHPKPGSIGRILPSLEYALLDVETGETAAPGSAGMLVLRGPSIFSGYLGDAPSPFVEYDGKSWYRTGDLVVQEEDGTLIFRGRLKRFVKIGGEMISLPAIEAVLQLLLVASDADDGPALAVTATESQERPELILLTTQPWERELVNQHIRDAGLSGLHNIRRVIVVESIPTLGTGKTDYRALQGMV